MDLQTPDVGAFVGQRAVMTAEDDPAELLVREFEPLYRVVHRYLVHRLFNPELAEELTAQTFYKAAFWRRLPGETELLRAWLLRTATNLANTHHRRERVRHSALGRILRLKPVEVDPTCLAPAGDERVGQVRNVLRALPNRHQTVIVLRYYMEMPFAEISSILGCAEVTVRARLSRAMREIRRRMPNDPD